VNVRLVALDIDGTLLPPRAGHLALPDPEITAAITALEEAGVVVVLASGRMYPGTARIARHLGLDTPLICQQGASIHHPDGTVAHRFAIELEAAHELADYAHTHGWPYAWFDAVRYVASVENPASDEYARVSGIDPEYHEAPQHAAIEPTGIDIISTLEHSNGIHRELSARYGDRVHFLDFPGVTAAHSPDATKGNALARLARELGIPRQATVAIGDSVNDAAMLRWAAAGITLPHADHYARAAADHVLPGDGVEHVAAFLRSLL
jgi:Cof subfamily protein (haloacid dehalogenase superfamily)